MKSYGVLIISSVNQQSRSQVLTECFVKTAQCLSKQQKPSWRNSSACFLNVIEKRRGYLPQQVEWSQTLFFQNGTPYTNEWIFLVDVSCRLCEAKMGHSKTQIKERRKSGMCAHNTEAGCLVTAEHCAAFWSQRVPWMCWLSQTPQLQAAIGPQEHSVWPIYLGTVE